MFLLPCPSFRLLCLIDDCCTLFCRSRGGGDGAGPHLECARKASSTSSGLYGGPRKRFGNHVERALIPMLLPWTRQPQVCDCPLKTGWVALLSGFTQKIALQGKKCIKNNYRKQTSWEIEWSDVQPDPTLCSCLAIAKEEPAGCSRASFCPRSWPFVHPFRNFARCAIISLPPVGHGHPGAFSLWA